MLVQIQIPNRETITTNFRWWNIKNFPQTISLLREQVWRDYQNVAKSEGQVLVHLNENYSFQPAR